MAAVEELRTSVPLLRLKIHETNIYGNPNIDEDSPFNTIGSLPYSYINYMKKNFQRLEHVDSAVQFDVLKFTFADPEFVFTKKAGEQPVYFPKETLETDINGISYKRRKEIENTLKFMKNNKITSIYDPKYTDQLMKDQMDDIYENAVKYYQGIWKGKDSKIYPIYSTMLTPSRYGVLILPKSYFPAEDKYDKYYNWKQNGITGSDGILCYTTSMGSTAVPHILSDSGIIFAESPQGKAYYATQHVFNGNPVTDGTNIILGEIKAETLQSFGMQAHKKKKVFGINIQWMARGSIWTIGYGNNAYNVFAPKTKLGHKINYKSQKFSGIISDIDMKFPQSGVPEITIIFTELLHLFRDVNMSRYKKFQWGLKRPLFKGIDVFTVDGKGTEGLGKDKKGSLSYFERNKERLRQLRIQGKSDSDILNKTLDIVFINMNFMEIIQEVCDIYKVEFYDMGGGLEGQMLHYFGVPTISYREQEKINMVRNGTLNEVYIDKKRVTKADLLKRDELLLTNGTLDSSDYYQADMGKKAIKNADADTKHSAAWKEATTAQRQIMHKLNNAEGNTDGILQLKSSFPRIEFAVWPGNQSAWDFLTQLILKPLNLQLIHIGTKVTLKHEVDPEGITLVGKYLNLLDQLVTIKQKISAIDTGGWWKDLVTAFKTPTDIETYWAMQDGQAVKYGTKGQNLMAKLSEFKRRRTLRTEQKGNRKKWGEFATEVETLIKEIDSAAVNVDDMSTAKLARVLKYDPANSDRYESHVTVKRMQINKSNLSKDYETMTDDISKVSKVKSLNELLYKVTTGSANFADNTADLTKKQLAVKAELDKKYPNKTQTPTLDVPVWQYDK